MFGLVHLVFMLISTALVIYTVTTVTFRTHPYLGLSRGGTDANIM